MRNEIGSGLGLGLGSELGLGFLTLTLTLTPTLTPTLALYLDEEGEHDVLEVLDVQLVRALAVAPRRSELLLEERLLPYESLEHLRV